MDWPRTLQQIEDDLCPTLNVWERVLYYHLMRCTHAAGRPTTIVAIGSLAKKTGISDFKVREVIRSLDAKACISIQNRSRVGHTIAVHLPSDIRSLASSAPHIPAVNLEEIDFYNDRKYRNALLDREGHRCFYTLKTVTDASAVLDHVVPLVDGGDNSYRNIVVASHDANALKQGKHAKDFVRELYRAGVLTLAEMDGRLQAIDAIQEGKLVPVIEASNVRDAGRR